MRAALITKLGNPPELAQVDEPATSDGETLVSVEAVSLNPIDLTVGSGTFYGGSPPVPYVLGAEAAGRTDDGSLVYLFGGGRGVSGPGFAAERVAVSADLTTPVPDGLDPAVAASLGIAGIAAWVPVTRKAEVGPGDRVLVLGATGTVGTIAVQAAKLRGAARVVAAGRRRDRLERVRELGADEIVELGDDAGDAVAAAFGGDGFTVCIDPVWGKPLAAVLAAAARGARIVHLGQSAGAEAPLRSADVRGKELVVRGHSNFALTAEERASAYRELADEVAAGRIAVDVERHPLDDVAAAWERQRSGGAKVVLTL